MKFIQLGTNSVRQAIIRVCVLLIIAGILLFFLGFAMVGFDWARLSVQSVPGFFFRG